MDKETVAVRDEDVEAVQCERGTAYMGALDERKHWQCPLQDIRTNPNRTSTEVLVLPFSFSLDFLRPDCPIPAGKHHSSPSTTRSLPKYTTFIDDWAFKRFFATNREIFSEFDKPNFLQFVQSGGLIHDTLFHFGTVLVVKRHVLSDCLSLLVSLRQV
ncbi:hypothetical protein C8J56DRAFT_1170124 [Mycena floridula]|nr:hypothetical protein C8J56DRAFT_1170124 [Mycena floridula]